MTDSDPILDIRSELPFLAGNSLPRRLAFQAINRLLGFHRINHHLREAIANSDESALSFFEAASREFQNEIIETGPGWSQLPEKGPFIIAANHPFGGPDAQSLSTAFLRRRSDLKIISNEFMAQVEPAREILINVGILSDDPESRRRNFASIRKAITHLNEGGALGIFPSGEVAHWSWTEKSIVESPWSPLLNSLVKKSNAPVFPLFIPGRNSLFFQSLGLIHPFLRTAWIGRQALRMRGTPVTLHLGNPVKEDFRSAWEQLADR